MYCFYCIRTAETMFMFMTVGWLTLLFIRKAPGSNLETIICYPESLSVFSQSFQDYGI